MEVKRTMQQQQNHHNASARVMTWLCTLALMLLSNQVALGQSSRIAAADQATYSELTTQYEAAKYAYLQQETAGNQARFEAAQAKLDAFEGTQLIAAKMGSGSQHLAGTAS